MSPKLIVHCAPAEKFIEPFIQFIEKHYGHKDHLFFIQKNEKFPITGRENVRLVSNSKVKLTLIYIYHLNVAQKIILHGLFDRKLILILFFQPWLLKKCYWVMWGGDLYWHRNRPKTFKSNQFEKIRAFVIRRMGHLVSHVRGDFELAQKWYGATGQYHECFMYPSNLYKEYATPEKQGSSINILLGNSADPTNNHFEILDKLASYKDEDILIYCPLSYGDAKHAEQVIKRGSELFGDKFIPLLEFMSFEKYLELLGQIDIGIFAHKRQQGMGNITTLLGFGKKVYMRSDVTSWGTFEQLGVRLYDVNDIEMTRLEAGIAKLNHEIISEYFSESTLIEQMTEIFK